MRIARVKIVTTIMLGVMTLGLVTGCTDKKMESSATREEQMLKELTLAFEEGNFEAINEMVFVGDEKEEKEELFEMRKSDCEDTMGKAYDSVLMLSTYNLFANEYSMSICSGIWQLKSEEKQKELLGNLDKLEAKGLSIESTITKTVAADKAKIEASSGVNWETASIEDLIPDNAKAEKVIEFTMKYSWGDLEYGYSDAEHIDYYERASYISVVYQLEDEWHMTLPAPSAFYRLK